MSREKNFRFKTFEYTRHVLQKADERDIDLENIEQAIEYGDIFAEYPEDKPYKSYLCLYFAGGRPLHICFAPVNEYICKVITAYEPSLLIFEADYKTKRKK